LRIFFDGLGWMAAWAGVAGLVNFAERTEWLALLMGADAAGCARELVVMSILADCCWMRLAFRNAACYERPI